MVVRHSIPCCCYDRYLIFDRLTDKIVATMELISTTCYLSNEVLKKVVSECHTDKTQLQHADNLQFCS